MHVIESFASSCGLKINKPFIFEKFYPLNFDKYIILETNDASQSAKNYDYWQEIVNLIYKKLKHKNISILQMCGQNDQRMVNTYTVYGYTFNQKAFLIKNSLLYVGGNNYSIQAASMYNRKIIGLYGNNYANNNRPYWSLAQDFKTIEPFNLELKPSFLPQENPKTINKIKPNQVAENILEFLNLDSKVDYKFIEIGNNYNNRTIEMVPTIAVNPQSLNVPHIIVRMDIVFNENILELQLQQGKCLIITDKVISNNILKKYKDNIVQIIYEVNQDNDPNFIKLVKSLNINYIMLSYLSQEEINKFKINYMDSGLIIKIPEQQKNSDKNIKYYKSNHFILSNNKLYMSEAAVYKDLPIRDFSENIQPIIDTEVFWKYKENYAFLS